MVKLTSPKPGRVFGIHLSPDEARKVEIAAEAHGLTATEYLAMAARERIDLDIQPISFKSVAEDGTERDLDPSELATLAKDIDRHPSETDAEFRRRQAMIGNIVKGAGGGEGQ